MKNIEIAQRIANEKGGTLTAIGKYQGDDFLYAIVIHLNGEYIVWDLNTENIGTFNGTYGLFNSRLAIEELNYRLNEK